MWHVTISVMALALTGALAAPFGAGTDSRPMAVRAVTTETAAPAMHLTTRGVRIIGARNPSSVAAFQHRHHPQPRARALAVPVTDGLRLRKKAVETDTRLEARDPNPDPAPSPKNRKHDGLIDGAAVVSGVGINSALADHRCDKKMVQAGLKTAKRGIGSAGHIGIGMGTGAALHEKCKADIAKGKQAQMAAGMRPGMRPGMPGMPVMPAMPIRPPIIKRKRALPLSTATLVSGRLLRL